MEKGLSEIRAIIIEEMSLMINTSSNLMHQQIKEVKTAMEKLIEEISIMKKERVQEKRENEKEHCCISEKLEQLTVYHSESLSKTQQELKDLKQAASRQNYLNILQQQRLIHSKIDKKNKEKDQLIEKLASKIKSLERDLEETNSYLKNMDGEIMRDRKKIKRDLVQMNMMEEESRPMQNLTPMGRSLTPSGPVEALSIDVFSVCYEKFNITGNYIQKVEDNEWRQLLSSTPLIMKKQSTLKIIKSKTNKIYLGVIDKKYIFDILSVEGEKRRKECVLFDLEEREVIVGSIRRKNKNNIVKFEEGTVIKMEARGKQLYWSIGGEDIANAEMPFMLSQQIVPFIAMCDKGDTIHWQ